MIDADGRIKTCLHYNEFGPEDTIFALEDAAGRASFLHKTARAFNCAGCFWDCKWQSSYLKADLQAARSAFGHNQ